MQVELDHVVLECAHPEETLAFLQGLLGLEGVRVAEYRAGEAPFLSARVGPGTIVDFFPPALWADPGQARNPNHLCFTLSAADAARARAWLEAAGVAIERTSDRNYGARGWGVAFYFTAPGGIPLEIRHYPAESA